MARRWVRAVIVLLSLALASSSLAQFRGGFGGRARPRLPNAPSYDGGFNSCRGMDTSGRRDGSGNGWTTDYPDADINFSIRLSELTKTSVSRQADGDPNHLTVPLCDQFTLRVAAAFDLQPEPTQDVTRAGPLVYSERPLTFCLNVRVVRQHDEGLRPIGLAQRE